MYWFMEFIIRCGTEGETWLIPALSDLHFNEVIYLRSKALLSRYQATHTHTHTYFILWFHIWMTQEYGIIKSMHNLVCIWYIKSKFKSYRSVAMVVIACLLQKSNLTTSHSIFNLLKIPVDSTMSTFRVLVTDFEKLKDVTNLIIVYFYIKGISFFFPQTWKTL